MLESKDSLLQSVPVGLLDGRVEPSHPLVAGRAPWKSTPAQETMQLTGCGKGAASKRS